MGFSGAGESTVFRSSTHTTKLFSFFQGFMSRASPVLQRVQ